MSDTQLTHSEESTDADLLDLDIAELRRFAKLMGVNAQRDWKKEDFVKAIKAKHAAAELSIHTSALSETNLGKDPLPPGHARILVHRDPSPGHSNSPIPVGLNGRTFFVPRGVEVVIPLEYVDVLADAKSTILRQKKEPSRDEPYGQVVEEDILSYPFQVLAVRPHERGSKFKSNMDQRSMMYERRVKFVQEFGKWPTIGELLEFENSRRLQDKVDAHLTLKK